MTEFDFIPTGIQLLASVVIAWISWRFWRFTVRPKLHPNEPKELPYWLPILGHAIPFFRDFNSAISKGRRHFHPSREPFTMTVAGQTIYVATSAEDVNAVWKNTKSISMKPIAMDMYVWGGIGEKSRKALFEARKGSAENGVALTPTQEVIELHHQQLRNGPRLDELMGRTLPVMTKQLDFSTNDVAITKTGESYNVSLLQLCIDIFMTGPTTAYFGPKLLHISPHLTHAFESWEHCNWKFLFQVPHVFSADMLAAKNTLTCAFANFYKLPQDQRTGSIFFVDALEDILRDAGLSEEEMGCFTLLHYWALVGNVYKLAFWLIAHLVHNPSLLHSIQSEVSPAVNGDAVDETYLLEKCPALESLFNEVLRLTVSSSLARVIMEPTVVGGKMLRPGNKIMLPISELHADVETWGSCPDTLQPNRFNENPKLSKSLAYRPWGGGHTLCPGRFFARRSVNAFVAVLLSRYDIEVVSSTFPKADGTRPSPGVILVEQGQDIELRCTPRQVK